MRRIVQAAHDEARRLLTAHRDLLERVTRRLLEREVMDGAELRALIADRSANRPGVDVPARDPEPRAPSPA